MSIENITKEIRGGVIGLLVMVGLILIASEPVEQEAWCRVFLTSKLAGFGLWGICALLYKRWESKGLLPEEFTEDE
ncbi:MAG: hypothetical protein IJX16_00040 [Clostridia bacterium]|nr:hypothetical protein [Clostridia bacterium]